MAKVTIESIRESFEMWVLGLPECDQQSLKDVGELRKIAFAAYVTGYECGVVDTRWKYEVRPMSA